jgi:uncharacterized membrane protein HdeD (DUF308 family)
MADLQTANPPSANRRSAFWITLARSILALTLGLGLILQPDKARPMLVNFMGVFWLTAGIMSLRWGASGERARRSSVVVGVVGIVAGTLILGRYLLLQLVGEAPIVLLLGFIIVLTGLVHVFEGFRTGVDQQRQRSWTSMVLGAFEIVLGVVVLVWRDEFGLFFYSVVTVWAFAAALVLLREALRQRARAKARVVN